MKLSTLYTVYSTERVRFQMHVYNMFYFQQVITFSAFFERTHFILHNIYEELLRSIQIFEDDFVLIFKRTKQWTNGDSARLTLAVDVVIRSSPACSVDAGIAI